MILDLQTLLSNAQPITATVVSTNVIDLGPVAVNTTRDIGKGKPTPLLIQVVQAFNNLTSLGVALQVADDAAFTVNVTTVWSATEVLANLIPGYMFLPEFVTRRANRRFLRLSYTVTGVAPTTGQITAGITMGNQSAPA